MRARSDLELDDVTNEKLAALYGMLFRETKLDGPGAAFVGLRSSKVKRSARSKRSLASVWELQHANADRGGGVVFGQRLRLRHFQTGAYLAFRTRQTHDSSVRSSAPAHKGGIFGLMCPESAVAPHVISPHVDLDDPLEAVLVSALRTASDEEDTLFSFEHVSSSEATSVGTAAPREGDGASEATTGKKSGAKEVSVSPQRSFLESS